MIMKNRWRDLKIIYCDEDHLVRRPKSSSPIEQTILSSIPFSRVFLEYMGLV